MSDGRDSERLLEAVLNGDIAADATEVSSRCARDPDFAAALAELLLVQRRLAAHGAVVREDLATPAPELEGAAERAMRALLLHEHARRQPVWPWLMTAVAAATIAAAVILWSRSTPEVHDQVLGGFRVEATEDGALRFHHALLPGEHFVVSVVNAAGKVVFTSEPTMAPTWRPDPELAARWQRGWRVEVEASASDIEPTSGQVVEGWQPRR